MSRVNSNKVNRKQNNKKLRKKNFWDHFKDVQKEMPQLKHNEIRKIASERLKMYGKKFITVNTNSANKIISNYRQQKQKPELSVIRAQHQSKVAALRKGSKKRGENKDLRNPYNLKFTTKNLDENVKYIKDLVDKSKNNLEGEAVDENGNTVVTVESERLVQSRLIDVRPVLDQRALTNIAFAYPLYGVANNILVDEMTTIGVQAVGLHWAAAVVIAYDLWLAAAGEISIFGAAPHGYWELRSAVNPTIDRGYKYSFIIPDMFVGVGGLYPGGFPLQSNEVSLAWVTNAATPLYTLANVIPVLNDDDIRDAGKAATDLWTAIATSNGADENYWRMMPCPEKSTYSDSSAIFAANLPLQTTSAPYRNYCLFRHENRIRASETWLCKLGLTTDDPNIPVPRRLGPWSMSDFVSASNLMTRIINAQYGVTKKNVIRPKYVMLEDIINATLSAVTEADLHKNEVIGTSGINSAGFNSILKSIEEPAFLYGMILGIVRKFQNRSLMGFDNTESGMYPCTGTMWATVGGSSVDMGANFINEMAASMAPLKQHLPGWDMERTAVLVTTGKFSINVYNGPNPAVPSNLVSLINVLQPDTNPVAYGFAATNILNLPTMLDPLNMGFSMVRGASIPTAQEIFSGALDALQGNLLVANVVGNSHTENTLLYYTRIIQKVEQNDPSWSAYYGATIRMISNTYPMEMNCVMYDLTKPLCVTFGSPEDYCALYHEYNTTVYSNGELRVLSEIITYAAKANAHPIAGVGWESAITEIELVEQGKGGGFLSNLADSIVPGIGSILSAVLPF